MSSPYPEQNAEQHTTERPKLSKNARRWLLRGAFLLYGLVVFVIMWPKK